MFHHLIPSPQPTLRDLVVVLCISLLLLASSPLAADTSKPYRLAVSSKAMGGVDSTDATAALKAWAATVEKEQNLSRSLETLLFTQPIHEIAGIFASGGYHGLGLTVAELLETGIVPKDVYVGNRGESPFLNYVIVVADKNKARNPQDLVSKRLVTSQSNQMLLAEPWFESLLAAKDLKGTSNSTTLEFADNLSKAILEVFFGQAEAALVTKDAFELSCELNPQVGKSLRVLAESPQIIPVLFVFQPKVAEKEDISELENAVLNLHKTPGGQQVLTVIQSNKMEKYPFKILQSTIDLLSTIKKG